MRGIIFALVLLVPFTAQADTDREGKELARHKSNSFFMITAEKRFSIEFDLGENGLREGMNSGEIVIHDSRDHDVQGAIITITPWMPDMGHGVPEIPVIAEKEGAFGSRYLVENLHINMGGHWEILVEVEKDGVKDGAVFDFPNVGG